MVWFIAKTTSNVDWLSAYGRDQGSFILSNQDVQIWDRTVRLHFLWWIGGACQIIMMIQKYLKVFNAMGANNECVIHMPKTQGRFSFSTICNHLFKNSCTTTVKNMTVINFPFYLFYHRFRHEWFLYGILNFSCLLHPWRMIGNQRIFVFNAHRWETHQFTVHYKTGFSVLYIIKIVSVCRKRVG